jgi:hypothetical protein
MGLFLSLFLIIGIMVFDHRNRRLRGSLLNEVTYLAIIHLGSVVTNENWRKLVPNSGVKNLLLSLRGVQHSWTTRQSPLYPRL